MSWHETIHSNLELHAMLKAAAQQSTTVLHQHAEPADLDVPHHPTLSSVHTPNPSK